MFEVLVFIVLAIVWFLLAAIQSNKPPVVKPADDEMPIDNADDQVDDNTPSIFIDKHLLSPSERSCPVNDAVEEFLIDGIVFKEKLGIEKFRDFEVFTNLKMDEYADNSRSSVDDDTPLQLYIQNAPNGVIINANVYLTHQQWNTLVVVSAATLSCAVCGVYCNEEHIKLDSHKANLDKCKPLEMYDLSITRRIDSYYHCAVCNLIFHKSQIDQHFSGKDHENKLLFAINKVSDIMYDYSLHTENNNVDLKKDTYHYNAKAIYNNTEDVSSESDVDYESHYNVYGINSDHDDDEDDEDFYANVEPPLNLEHSYASMARKPKTDELPSVLEIDLGNKMVTVKFDSWHMVISPKANMFYCMVCTQYDHIRKKSRHCKSEDHLTRLQQCRVIEMYEKYLVRQVDEKLYHCGHCNNLQLIHEMEDHIQSQHPAAKSTNFDSPKKPATPLKNYNKDFKAPNPHAVRNITDNFKNGNNENQPVANVNGAVKNGHEVRNAQRNVQCRNENNANQMTGVQPRIGNTGKLDMYHALRSANNYINDDIVICAYGNKIRITKLAFNIVCGRDNDFYCGLCEVSVNKEHLKMHVNDLQHLILLQGSPFIEAFNIHLYRQIRDALHCAVCNELIQLIPEIILSHKLELKHIINLGKALGHIKSDALLPNELKIAEKSANNSANGTTKASNVKVEKNSTKTAAKEIPHITATVSTPVPKAIDENLAPLQTYQKIAVVPPKIETKEFIEVKHGIKEDLEDDENEDLNDSSADDAEFDFEEYLYVKLGNSYIKITNTSYHTLVDVGDGTKYCFVCSVVVNDEFKKHVDSRAHMENMEKYKFVDKYKEDLFRQIYLMYHCSICNVLITRKQVSHHLSWPTHVLQTDNTKISSKQRKNEIKAGTKQVTASTQKENIYLNETETKIKIILNIAIQKENVVSVARKNKIVIFNDNVLKISFDFWHGLSAMPSGWKCKVCQSEFDGKEFASHVSSEWHKGNLDKFEKQYSPALIRKINDTTLNCIICNTELANRRHIILEHIQGKKHIKNYDSVLHESSLANSYADCDDDVLML